MNKTEIDLLDGAIICRQIELAAKKAGDLLIQFQHDLGNLKIQEKSANQLVSEADIQAEKLIVQELRTTYPMASFITEEDTANQAVNDLCFIIDPLDGTTNFLHGLDLYSISIAATLKDSLIAGVVHIPSRNQLFRAVKGQGAFLNNEPIFVSKSSTINDSLLATGFPFYAFDEMDNYITSLSYLMQNTRGLRRMGSAAIDLAYTACGKFCGFFELNLHTWDVAAGILLVQEAGGKVSTFKGVEGDLSGKEIMASNSTIYSEFKSILNRNFYEK